MKVTGKIVEKAISSGVQSDGTTPWNRASFTIGDRKFSTFDEKLIKAFNPGDTVEVTYGKSADGKYNNISEMNKAEESEIKPADASEAKGQENTSSIWEKKDLRISRMNALTNAANLLSMIGLPEKTTRKEAIEIVKGLAEDLVKYIYG